MTTYKTRCSNDAMDSIVYGVSFVTRRNCTNDIPGLKVKGDASPLYMMEETVELSYDVWLNFWRTINAYVQIEG